MSRATWLTLIAIEAREIASTWQRWVIPGMMALVALTSPLVALWQNDLMSALAPAMIDTHSLPDPTWHDAAAQWLKNLGQIGIFVVVFAGAQAIGSPRSGGFGVHWVSRGIAPGALVATRVLTQAGLVTLTCFAGAGVCAGLSGVLFGEVGLATWLACALAWTSGAVVLLGAVALASVRCGSLGSGVVGIGAWVVLRLAAANDHLREWTAAGTLTLPDRLLAEAEATWWPAAWAIATFVLSVGCATVWANRSPYVRRG